MGRPTSFDVDILKKKAESYLSEFSTCIPAPRDTVWIKLAADLGHKYSPKYLWTIFKSNRHNICGLLGLNQEDSRNQDKTTCEETVEGTSSSGEEETTSTDLPKISFSITLSNEEWCKISPRQTIYKCNDKSNPSRLSRTYEVLPPESCWTAIINSHMWDHTKLPCCLSFKRCKINRNGEIFLKIAAICSECESTLEISMAKEPIIDSRAILCCTYAGNFDLCRNNKKRRILRMEKETTFKEFISGNQSASSFRGRLINESLKLGEKEPSHIPSVNSLRLMKSRVNLKQRLHSDPVQALLIMRYSDPFHEIIREIRLDPFFVIYWSNAQVSVYNNFCTFTPLSSISIDATGGIVNRISRPFGNKSRNIFLYSVVIHDAKNESQISICNMLSERHNVLTILHFLNSFFKGNYPVGVKMPKQAVCDHSIPLLSALVQSLTQFPSLNAYLQNCAYIITDPAMIETPHCFIRCDVAHVVKIIASWKPLKNMTRRIRQFYIRSVCLLIQSVDIEDIEKILYSIFVVCLSPDSGIDEMGVPMICEVEKDRLKRWISVGFPEKDGTTVGQTINEILNTETQETAIDAEEIELESASDDNIFDAGTSDGENTPTFKQWGTKIVEKAKRVISETSSEDDNALYLPDLANCLLNLVETLPLWTALMIPVMKYGTLTASSTSVESSFNDIKTRMLGHVALPLSVDVFLMHHAPHIEAALKVRESRHQGEVINDEPRLEDTTEHGNKLTEPTSNKENRAIAGQLKCSRTKSPVFSPCPACQRGDTPSGAHGCVSCGKNVHIIFKECCRRLEGEEEGYGQGAICVECDRTTSNKQVASSNDRPEDLSQHSSEEIKSSLKKKQHIRSQDKVRQVETSNIPSCPACERGDTPTGAHKCVSCGKSVHIIFEECCRRLEGEEEGYGQGAICVECDRTTSNKQVASSNDRPEDLSQHSSEEIKSSLKKKQHVGSQDKVRQVETSNVPSCPACERGDTPTGAHKCVSCGKSVHIIFEGCSRTIDGSDEGFGQGAICVKCYRSTEKQHIANTNKQTGVLFTQFTTDGGDETVQEETCVENWRGQGLPLKKRSRHSYLTPNMELKNVDLSSKGKPLPIGLLKNGSRGSNLKPVVVGKKKIIVTNTCAFDSIMQILACGYCDSQLYRDFVDSQPEDMHLWRIVKHMDRLGMSKWPYKWRAELLNSLFKSTELKYGVSQIEATTVAGEMCRKILEEYPSVREVTSCSANECRSSVFSNVTLFVQWATDRPLLIAENVTEMLKSQSSICAINGSAFHSKDFHISPVHLIIEIQVLNKADEIRDSDIGSLPEVRLLDIPTQVVADSTVYHLRGGVSFSSVRGKDIKVIGHYTSYCRRLDGLWEVYNDLEDKKTNCSRGARISFELLIYTV